MPESTSTVLAAQGGIDKWSYRKFFVAKDANGNVLTDHSYWVNSAQAISSTPLHNDDYVILLMNSGLSAAGGVVAVIRVHYHVEWFEMQYAV